MFVSGVASVVAKANSGNKPSIIVLEKPGFNKIGYKQTAPEINGVWLDEVVYELRRS